MSAPSNIFDSQLEMNVKQITAASPCGGLFNPDVRLHVRRALDDITAAGG